MRRPAGLAIFAAPAPALCGAGVGAGDGPRRRAPNRASGPTCAAAAARCPASCNAGRSGGDGARWSNYGDPGGTYAGPDGAVAHYDDLLWSLPRTTRGLLPGGGIIEAILPAGTLLSLCTGQRLRLPAFDVRGTRNGHVDFGYLREGPRQDRRRRVLRDLRLGPAWLPLRGAFVRGDRDSAVMRCRAAWL